MLPPNLVNIALSKKHALVRSHRFLEVRNYIICYVTLIETTLLRIWGTGALWALFWGTRLGHLGHSFGELRAPGALVWGT